MRSLFFVSPQLVIVLGSLFVLTAGLWVKSKAFVVTSTVLSLLIAIGLYISMIGKAPQDAFAGLLVFDPFGTFFSIFIVGAVTIAAIVSAGSKEVSDDRYSEYFAILLALASGMVFMSISNHLLMIYLALETVSILSYCMAGFHKERHASVEASLKYVVYGSMASAAMVFGMSLLYGVTGELTLTGLREYVNSTGAEQMPLTLWGSVVLIFAGIGYKISAAPMHMWTPDVYEGAPTPVSALLSVAPKAAGFALLVRFFVTGLSLPVGEGLAVTTNSNAADPSFFATQAFNWPLLLTVSSVFTMFMGNLAALGQVSVKRILAYSSIAHAGYMLMGITTQTSQGLEAILFYTIVYCFMNLGAFWIASMVEDTMGGDHLRHFRGLIYRKPFHAVAMTIFMFSLLGLPPFAGFIGKWFLFYAVIAREMYGFVAMAAINSAIGLYYYVKIIKAMILEAPEVEIPAGRTAFDSKAGIFFLTLLVIPNIVLGIYFEPVMKLVKKAIYLFVNPS